MIEQFTGSNAVFTLGTVFMAVLLSFTLLLWSKRFAERRSLDQLSAGYGVFVIACWLSLLIVLSTIVDPCWETFDRAGTMSLTKWDLFKYLSFFLASSLLLWFILVRVSFFIFRWVYGQAVISGALKGEAFGLILTWGIMLLFITWLAQIAFVKLVASMIPYPDLPTFN